MKNKGNSNMQVQEQKSIDDIVDGALKDAGIEIDENSAEPVVFD